MSKEELLEIIVSQDEYITKLENEIEELKKEQHDKSSQDYEDNRNLVSDLLTNLAKGV